MLAKGAKPVVNGSGLSEKALRKPVLLACRYIRMIKASIEVATILRPVRQKCNVGCCAVPLRMQDDETRDGFWV